MDTIRSLAAVGALAVLSACGPTVTLTPPGPVELYSTPPPGAQPTVPLTCTVADPAGLPVSSVCSLANSNAAAGTLPATSITITSPATSGTITFTALPVTIDETTNITATFRAAPPATTTITVHPPRVVLAVGARTIQIDPSVTRSPQGLLRYTYFIQVTLAGALDDDLVKVGAVFTKPVTPVTRACTKANGTGIGTLITPSHSPDTIYIVTCNVVSATATITFDTDANPGGTASLEIFLQSAAGSSRMTPTGPR